MFINIRAWRNADARPGRRRAPTWCCTTASAAFAIDCCNSSSPTIGALSSRSRRSRARSGGRRSSASAAIRTNSVVLRGRPTFGRIAPGWSAEGPRRPVRRRRARVAVEGGGACFGSVPTAILDRVYDVVARNRYRLFGRYDQLPDAASRIPPPIHRLEQEAAMKIVIPGGSGQVGTILARAFHGRGDHVVVLSRRAAARPWRVVAWDGATLRRLATRNRRLRRRHQSGRPERQLPIQRREPPGDSAVARAVDPRRRPGDRAGGASAARCGCKRAPPRFTRIATTGPTTSALAFSAAASRTPRARGDSASTSRGRGSRRSTRPRQTRTRKVALRSAMSMSPDRGRRLRHAARAGASAASAAAPVDGRQFMSWIHDEDFVRAVHWLIDARRYRGRRQRRLAKSAAERRVHAVLREACGASLRTAREPVDARDRRGLLADGNRADAEEPPRRARARLLEHGFSFRFPHWNDAARDLCDRWRVMASASSAA